MKKLAFPNLYILKYGLGNSPCRPDTHVFVGRLTKPFHIPCFGGLTPSPLGPLN